MGRKVKQYKLHFSDISDEEMLTWSKEKLIEELRLRDTSCLTALRRGEMYMVKYRDLKEKVRELESS